MTSGFVIGIPSYKRANDQKTLEYLESIGTPRGIITISVQSQSDLDAYRKAGVDKRVGEIIYRPGNCVADNRNAILDHFPKGTHILQMEDDISEVDRLVIIRGKKRLSRIDTFEELSQVATKGFSLAQKYGTVAFGMNLVTNPFYMSSKVYRTKMCGFGVYGIINTDLRFDNRFTVYDDPEFEARVIKKYRAQPVFDCYTAINTSLKARKGNKSARGGCAEAWNSHGIKERMLRLMKILHGDIYDIDPTKENCITLKREISSALNYRK